MVKVIEVIASCKEGFTEATQKAVEKASKTVNNIQSVYINADYLFKILYIRQKLYIF